MKKFLLLLILLIVVKSDILKAQSENRFDLHINGGKSFLLTNKFSNLEGTDESGYYVNFGLGYFLLDQLKIESNIRYSTYPRKIYSAHTDESGNNFYGGYNVENLKVIDANLAEKLYFTNREDFFIPFFHFGVGGCFLLNKDEKGSFVFSIDTGFGTDFNIGQSFYLILQSQFTISFFRKSQLVYMPITLGISHTL